MLDNNTFEKLKNPNESIVKSFANAFDICFYRDEKELMKWFHSERIITKSIIISRVRKINALYHTHLWEENIIDIVDFLSNKGGIEFENRIVSGDLNVIKELVAQNNRNCFVFATKYCSFVNSDCFPMYDSYVASALLNFHNSKPLIDGKLNFEKFRKDCDYKAFKDALDKFVVRYKLYNCSYREIDKYLWLVGKNVQ